MTFKQGAVILGALTLNFVILIVWLAFGQSQCLSRGYPDMDMTITGKLYCSNQVTAVAL